MKKCSTTQCIIKSYRTPIVQEAPWVPITCPCTEESRRNANCQCLGDLIWSPGENMALMLPSTFSLAKRSDSSEKGILREDETTTCKSKSFNHSEIFDPLCEGPTALTYGGATVRVVPDNPTDHMPVKPMTPPTSLADHNPTPRIIEGWAKVPDELMVCSRGARAVGRQDGGTAPGASELAASVRFALRQDGCCDYGRRVC
ncbi:hypothetical protein AVEN_23757-1 [Araneus ventricosus]|uniref:Uncharacterized protein n=1 Tax=Araneus ventricosus TaxID=182803 RepID=A0A4Y2SFJ1_ARAVE|nr:hypothetical protein AVEN_23757-1 [Araneus ventricosus]